MYVCTRELPTRVRARIYYIIRAREFLHLSNLRYNNSFLGRNYVRSHNLKPLDVIHVKKDGSGSFEGEDAITVWQLALVAQGLKLELSIPLRKRSPSNLKIAKEMTGLRTNNRVVQLERILVMLEQAKTQVVFLEEE